MTIFDRIGRLFGRKAVVSTLLNPWDEGKPVYAGTKFSALAREGWRKNELIFACIDRTALTVSQVHMDIQDSKTGKILEQHPLKQLLQRPNSEMTEFDFWQSVIIYQYLAGVAYYEKERSEAGRVVGLWPMRPDWTQPIRSSTQVIGGYRYEVPGHDPVLLPREDVLVFKSFDPLNMYGGWPPAAVAARAGDVDNSTTDFIKLFWERGAMPAGVLTSDQQLTSDDVTTIRKRWMMRYGGHQQWLAPAVLDKNATYTRTGLTFGEMGFEALDSRNEARICMALRVPPILVGAAIGLERSTYSNYEQARKSWWQDVLLGLYEHYDDVINNDLAPEFGGGVRAVWDFSGVAGLQEDINQQWSRYADGLRAGALTVNDYRRGVGLPAVRGGDVFIRGLAQFDVPAVVQTDQKSLPGHETKRFDRDAAELEAEREIEDFLSGQLERLTAELEAEAGVSSIFDEAFWRKEGSLMLMILLPLISRMASGVARDAYDDLAAQVDVGGYWGLVNQAALDWAGTHAATRVTNVTETTKQLVRDKVQDWIASPAPLPDLTKELEPYFGKVRAKRIAVTEVTNTYAQANLITWRTSGFVHRKRWHTAGQNVCEICLSLDGQDVGINDLFTDYAGNTYDAPTAHVNCKCYIEPVVEV